MFKFYSKFYAAIFTVFMQISDCSLSFFAKEADLYNHAIKRQGFQRKKKSQKAFNFFLLDNTSIEERTLEAIKQRTS